MPPLPHTYASTYLEVIYKKNFMRIVKFIVRRYRGFGRNQRKPRDWILKPSLNKKMK